MSFITRYNGKNDRDIGVLTVRRPNIPSPTPKVETYEIPGQDGSLFSFFGFYEDINIPVELNFMTPLDEWGAKVRQVKEWLLDRNGDRRLSFSDDMEFFYVVKNVDVGEITRTSRRIGTLTPNFTCEPYIYFSAGTNKMTAEEASLNPFMISQPVYYLTGEGNTTLNVNGKEVTANVGKNLTIDTKRKISYRQDGSLMNTAISGNYEDLWLQPGQNEITVTGGIELKIAPYWRTL